jgi:hypothetical protein
MLIQDPKRADSKSLSVRASDLFRQRAKALLDELNAQTGPENLPDWNIRAGTLLTFEFCRLLATQTNDAAIFQRKECKNLAAANEAASRPNTLGRDAE